MTRAFGDYVDYCPKCRSWMGPDASMRWRDEEHRMVLGSLPWSYEAEPVKRSRLEISCGRCGWLYEMEPADLKVEAIP